MNIPAPLRKSLRSIFASAFRRQSSTCGGIFAKALIPTPPFSQSREPPRAFSRAFDRCLHSVVRHAAAESPVHPFANFCVRGIRILVQQRFGGHDLPVLTEPALWHLLLNPSLLDRMQFAVRGQPPSVYRFAFHGRDCGVTQDRVATPSMITVQPTLGQPAASAALSSRGSLRSTYSSGVEGLTSNECVFARSLSGISRCCTPTLTVSLLRRQPS